MTTPAPENGAATLTMPQAIMLRTACEDGYIPTSYSDSQSDDKYKAILSLVELGLLKQSLDHFVVPTAKGRAVLAAAQSAGEKPETITIKQYCDDGWSLRKDCKVSLSDYAASWIERVDPSYNNVYFIDFQDHEGSHFINVEGNYKLTVTWLPAPSQTEPATVGGESAEAGWYFSSVVQWIPEYSESKINGYTGPFPTWQSALEVCFKELNDDMDRIRDQRQELRADNERLSAQLAALTDRLAGVEADSKDTLRTATENLDEIWAHVTAGKIGSWDYPAQVVRHVGHMSDDFKALEADKLAAAGLVEAAKAWAHMDADAPMDEGIMVTDHLLGAVAKYESATGQPADGENG